MCVCLCVCGGVAGCTSPPERLSCQRPEPTLWPCDSPLELRRRETSCSSPSRIYPCTQHQHRVIGRGGAHSFVHSFTHMAVSLSAQQIRPVLSRNSPLLTEGGCTNRQSKVSNGLVRQVPSSLGDLQASGQPQRMVERALNLEAENFSLCPGFLTSVMVLDKSLQTHLILNAHICKMGLICLSSIRLL